MRFLRRLGILVIALCFIFTGFLALVRPWYLSWGSTEEEQRMRLPGDDIVAHAGAQNTRAITIHAHVDRVWPWLAQLGQDRAGFYSFELLENIVGCEMPTSDSLHPELQGWKIGDKLWMYPPHKAGGAAFATLRVHEPGRALGFATRTVGTTLDEPEDGSWSFVLRPIDASTTRLLIRGRMPAERSVAGLVFDRAIFEPVHYVMERRMMLGLAAASEGRSMSSVADEIQVALWTLTFGLVGLSTFLLLFTRRWQLPLVGFVSSLIVFQVLTFAQPPIFVGSLLVAGVIAVLWWPSRRTRDSSMPIATTDQASSAT